MSSFYICGKASLTSPFHSRVYPTEGNSNVIEIRNSNLTHRHTHTQRLTTDRVTVLKQRQEFKYWEFLWLFSPTTHMMATDEEARALMIKPPWLANKRAHGVLRRCTAQEAEYLPNMKYLSFPTRKKKRPWFMCAEFVLVRSRCRQRLCNLCTSKMLFAVKLE